MSKRLTFSCIKVTQPLGDFYIGSIPFQDLCEITKIDIRRLVGERDFETYLGIQRPRIQKRVKEISQYIETADACFPTSVILAILAKCAQYDEKTKELTLQPYIDVESQEKPILYEEIANVLDGQHRIEGLKASNYEGDFEINVSIFVDMDIADQAYIFSTINLAQTRVNKSLVYDLFSLAKKRSPQKTCHHIAVALDKNKESPFFQRIKRLGRATEGRFNETITQATFVEALLKYVSDDPVRDRDIYLRNGKPKLKNAEELEKLIFSNMFIENKDLEITDVIWNYFNAVKQKWPEAWEAEGEGNILNKTNGFKALMRFLRPAYLHITKPGKAPKTEKFYEIFHKINLKDDHFTTDQFKPGTSGESWLYHTLCNESKLK